MNLIKISRALTHNRGYFEEYVTVEDYENVILPALLRDGWKDTNDIVLPGLVKGIHRIVVREYTTLDPQTVVAVINNND